METTQNMSKTEDRTEIELVAEEDFDKADALREALAETDLMCHEIPMDEGYGGWSNPDSNDNNNFFLEHGRVSAFSVTGPRENNEDSTAYDNYMGWDILAIADGVGGAPHGEVASALATENFVRAALKLIDMGMHPYEVIVRATHSANQSVVHVTQAMSKTHADMCCTLIGAIVKDNVAYLTHTGDSRAYVCNPGTGAIKQITTDHSLFEFYKENQAMFDKMIVDGSESNDFDVLDDSNVYFVTRGQRYWGRMLNKVIGERDIKPDYFTVVLEEDEALLLCTDGVSNGITKTENIGRALHGIKPHDNMASELVTAVRCGDYGHYVDNTTAIVLCANKTDKKKGVKKGGSKN